MCSASCVSILLLCFFVTISDSPGFARSAPQKKDEAAATRKKTSAALTAQQRRGLSLLQSARRNADSTKPAIRTVLLLRIADGYNKIDPNTARALRKQAFEASLVIEDVAPPQSEGEGRPSCPELAGCGIRRFLQREILASIQSPELVESLAANAEPRVQHDVRQLLISRYVAKKELNKANNLLALMASDTPYPYEAAMQLMKAEPPDRRPYTFNQALQAFQRNGIDGEDSDAFAGMPGMVLRFWHDVPSDLVLDAIDSILETAKKNPDLGSDASMTVSGKGSRMTFSSWYEYRALQLLPILLELDKSRAERILNDDSTLRVAMQRFPKGLQDLQTDYEMHPPAANTPVEATDSVSFGNSMSANMLVQAQQQIERRQKEIAAEAASDPRQALVDALSLPEIIPGMEDSPMKPPRAKMLLWLAKTEAKKNADIAKDALGAAAKSLGKASLIAQAETLDDIATQYVALKDQGGALETLKEGIKVAERLYRKDTNMDNPNQAFKDAWPSTGQWRRCVQISSHISVDMAAGIVAGIDDPEIAALMQVYLANSLIGVTSRAMPVAEVHKRTGVYSIL